MSRSSIVVAVLLAVIRSLPGCRVRDLLGPEAVRSTASPVTLSPTTLETRAEIRPRALHGGDTLHVRVTVINHLTDTVRVAFPSTCTLEFEVRDAFGRYRGPFYACGASGITLELAPGESRSSTFDWKTDDWASSRASLRGAPHLPPGLYAVMGGLALLGPRLSFRSPAVRFRVLPLDRNRLGFLPFRF